MIPQDYISELYAAILKKKLSKDALALLKVRLCKKYKLKEIPTDIQLYLTDPDPQIKRYLLTKPVRSISGVIPIAIMTKPDRCPHGKCTFCPGGPGSAFGDVPQSYTGKEPASMRGMRAGWDPYIQVFNRLEQYVVLGHVPEKVEIIVMGGTVMAVKDNYIEEFAMYTYKAMNDFSDQFYREGVFDIDVFKEFFEMPGDVHSKERVGRIQNRLRALKKTSTLENEQKRNERSNIRCVGFTIETKPDWGFAEHGNRMLALGCTRVELGIQSVYNKPLLLTGRGHGLKENIKSIRELKDLGFKLNFHYMLGLPGVSKEKDIEGFKQLFSNPDFRPDMLKIYPCMVMPGTLLYDQWKAGKYQPLNTEEAAEMIAECFRYIPKYCRVMRVQRDIPTYRTAAGVGRTNLRQYVDEIMKKKGIVSQDIRAREIKGKIPKGLLYETIEYDASQGKEFFIEAKTKDDHILGYCRLRFPSDSLRNEITKSSALLRELHVFGTAMEIKGKKGVTQHTGIGKELLSQAESICKKNKKDKLVVISGVGVREYYLKKGYKREGPYMVRRL